MDTGSSAFILICSAMVCLMTPALAFFYGGLGRRKNVINTMMMSVLPLAIASLLWIVAGYSLSFGGHGNIFGNFSHLFLNGVSETASSRGLTIPDMLFAAFQMMFSIICVAILTGSVVGRMRFTPLAIFVVFWLILVYYPFAHMVWDEGLLAKWGTIDFAGGDVVHITSGVSALVLAIVVGKRRDGINKGDKVGVIGVNGTGKSTLLKIIAGIEEPDEGNVIKGRNVTVTYLAQSPDHAKDETVLSYVLRGKANASEAKAKEILNKLGIGEFDASMDMLSGGQKKRVALAKALVEPTEVLILDEPTNHLDNDMVVWLEQYIKAFKGDSAVGNLHEIGG